VAQSTENYKQKIYIRSFKLRTLLQLREIKRRVLISNTHHSENRSITRVICGAKRNEKRVSCSGVEARDFKIKLT